MATAQLGIILQSISGKVGNAVFHKTKDGIIVAPRTKGSNPNTAAQQLVRAALTKASRDWKNFDLSTVQAWENYAAGITFHNRTTGQAYTPTGINAYTELASKFYQMNPTGTAPTTPPAAAFNGDNVTITAVAATGKITFTASAANAAGVTTEFLVQTLASKNRKPQKNGYRVKGYYAFVTGTLSHDIDVPTGYYAAGYRFVSTATGQASAPVYFSETEQVAFTVTEGKKAA